MLTARFVLTSIYGGGSFFVYTMIIRMMIKNWKDYNSTFFRLYIADYFFNLLTFLNSFITLRAPQNTCNTCPFSFLFESQSSAEDHTFPLNVFFTVHYTMAFIQYSMIFLISLNRFTMVLLVNNYEKYWKPSLPWILAAVLLLPFTQTWPLATHNAFYLYTPQLEGYTTKTVMDVTELLNVLVAFMVITTVLTATVNILSIFRLACLADRITGAEKNLFYVSFVSFLIQAFAAGDTMILRYAVSDANRNTMGAQLAQVLMPFASDFLTISHPWTLLYFSTKARNSMFTYYFPLLKGRILSASTSAVVY